MGGPLTGAQAAVPPLLSPPLLPRLVTERCERECNVFVSVKDCVVLWLCIVMLLVCNAHLLSQTYLLVANQLGASTHSNNFSPLSLSTVGSEGSRTPATESLKETPSGALTQWATEALEYHDCSFLLIREMLV